MTAVAVDYVEEMIKRKCMHEVHTSERRSYRGCRRRWNWHFRDRYTPPTTPKPLEFGVAYHLAMQIIHDPKTWNFTSSVLGALAEKGFVDECKRQYKEFCKARDMYGLEADAEKDYNERVDLGRGMIRYYVAKHLPKLQAEYTPIAVEISFDVPIKDEYGNQLFCKCKQCRKTFAETGGGRWKGNPVVYSGRVDLVVQDRRGDYWIWDWKSTSRMSGDGFEELLELDSQVGSYCWALIYVLGLRIRGFIYFEILKGFPEPPKKNKVPRLERWYSVNQNQMTDYETYLETVREKDSYAYEAGLYDGFLAYLKASGPTFFKQTPIYKTDYQLYEIGRNILLEVREMLNPDLAIYPSDGRFACSTCAFKLPCLEQNSGGDFQYVLDSMFEKSEPYYRRQKQLASTESKGGE